VDALLRALSRVVLVDRTLEDVLGEITSIAKLGIRGAEAVSITLLRNEKAFTAAYDGAMSLAADELQYERGYGPCMDAGRTGTVLLIDDTRVETRWPDYTAHVAARGVLSSLSVPLPIQTDVIGALNIYSRTPSAFSIEAVEIAEELAGHVAVAVGNAIAFTEATTRVEQMRKAMDSRSIIDQAMGVIMAQNRCDADAAFAILTRASQNRNIKLREIARSTVRSVSRPPGS
jgi:GAF domain-containing protein